MQNNLTQCDCCDYFSVSGEDYEICSVCYWEQDSFGIKGLDEESGANHGLTLREGQANFVALSVCQACFKDNVLSVEGRSKFAYKLRNL
jgi:hypothetical protein